MSRWRRDVLVLAVAATFGTPAALGQPSSPRPGPDAAETPCERDASRIGSVQMQLVEAALKLDLIEGDADFVVAPMIGCATTSRARVSEPLILEAGRDYRIVAVCEASTCLDLDLVILDEGRNTVGADLEPGAEPRIDLRPPWTGRYVLHLTAPGCLRPKGCAYAVGVFARRQP
jgi:hypothetical protein